MGEAGGTPSVAPSNPWGAEERRPPRPPHPKRLGYAHVLGGHPPAPLRPVMEQSDASPQKRRRWEVSHAPLALPTDSGQFVFLTKPEAGHAARTSACQQAVPPRPPEFMLRRAADLHLAAERNPSPRVMPRRVHADLDSAVEAWCLAPSRVAAARVGRRVGRDRPPLPLDSRWLKREAREHSVARLRRKVSQADADLARALEASLREAADASATREAALKKEEAELRRAIAASLSSDSSSLRPPPAPKSARQGKLPMESDAGAACLSERRCDRDPQWRRQLQGIPERTVRRPLIFDHDSPPCTQASSSSAVATPVCGIPQDEVLQLELAIAQSARSEEERAQREQACLRGFIESLETASVQSPILSPSASVDSGDVLAHKRNNKMARMPCESLAIAKKTGRLMALRLLEEHVAGGNEI